MIAHYRYLSYVLRHKWFVLLAGLRTHAPLWCLLVHDWSKFLPCEWFPYVRKFYGSAPALNPAYFTSAQWREMEREVWQATTDLKFDRAWLHHQHASPHHWQHWILRRDDGDTIPIQMPEHFVREMVADWMGAGRAITGKWEVAQWYDKNHHKMILHPATRSLVEHLIGTLAR